MTARYPRVWLQINGTTIPCISAEVSRTATRKTNRFSCEISTSMAARFGITLASWADFQPADASIIMSLAADGSDQRTMVTGSVDTPEIDMLANTISLKSRDKSASLTEKKRNEKKQNQKSSEIVESIAKDHGLTAQVQSTGDYAGQKWDQDTVSLFLNRSDWEILDDLADREGFRWYVDGASLFFEPDDQANGSFAVHYTPPSKGQMASGNVIQIKLNRNMTAARPHEVSVKSWHHKDKTLYSATHTMSGVGDKVMIEHHHNGRNQQQVENLARARLKNATRHDMNVSLEMPADLTCDVRQRLTLSGTGTIYDQSYDIDSVGFEVGWATGALMTIEAKSPKVGRSSGNGSGSTSAAMPSITIPTPVSRPATPTESFAT